MVDKGKGTDTNNTTSADADAQATPNISTPQVTPTPSDKPPRPRVSFQTNVGRVRTHNEDWVEVYEPTDEQEWARKGGLYIVADGMGGHRAGEVASRGAAQQAVRVYYADPDPDVGVCLTHAVESANLFVYNQSMENPAQMGMGTTLVAAVVRGHGLYVANVGDSRAYLMRNETIRQITHDHSWVEEQVRAGIITPEQARHHPQRNVITRALGSKNEVQVDIFAEEWRPNDIMVLCTDGLSGLVTDDEISAIVRGYPHDEAAARLVAKANECGGGDNISVVVLRANADDADVSLSSNRQDSPIARLRQLTRDKVHSAYICVKDMERAVQFYEQFLGQSAAVRGETLSVLVVRGFSLSLFDCDKVDEDVIHGGNYSFSCEVSDIDKSIETLNKLGAKIVSPLTKIGRNWVLEFEDPESNRIEIYCKTVDSRRCRA